MIGLMVTIKSSIIFHDLSDLKIDLDILQPCSFSGLISHGFIFWVSWEGLNL